MGYFGEGSGEIFLDNVKCGGFESSLLLCGHAPIGVNNCDHDEDVGVACLKEGKMYFYKIEYLCCQFL